MIQNKPCTRNPIVRVGGRKYKELLSLRTTMPQCKTKNTMQANDRTTHALIRYTARRGQLQGPKNHSTAANATECNKCCLNA